MLNSCSCDLQGEGKKVRGDKILDMSSKEHRIFFFSSEDKCNQHTSSSAYFIQKEDSTEKLQVAHS